MNLIVIIRFRRLCYSFPSFTNGGAASTNKVGQSKPARQRPPQPFRDSSAPLVHATSHDRLKAVNYEGEIRSNLIENACTSKIGRRVVYFSLSLSYKRSGGSETRVWVEEEQKKFVVEIGSINSTNTSPEASTRKKLR